jgi:DNA-binding transcriptional LysR family regulator
MGTAVQWDERIGRRLKLRDLHIFMTVAQQGSMGRAAKQLAVSQPVVSKVISDLERMLNVRLVDRTIKGVVPTVYGSALLRRGTIVFDELAHSVKEIEFLANPAVGEVRIASAESLNSTFLPAVIDRLSRKFPRLSFYVFSIPGATAQHLEILNERRVDLALANVPAPFEHDDLTAEFLYSDALIVVASRDSKWARRRKIELAELVDEPWCLPAKESLAGPATLVARAFRERGLGPPRNFVTTDSTHLRAALIATGRVLSPFSTTRLQLSGKHSGLKAVPVDLRIPSGSVGIVTLKNRTINPAAELFIEGARQLAKQLAET